MFTGQKKSSYFRCELIFNFILLFYYVILDVNLSFVTQNQPGYQVIQTAHKSQFLTGYFESWFSIMKDDEL